MIKYEFQRGGICSHWYAIKNNVTVAIIDKFDDTSTETNPFKVIGGARLQPDTCFWPNNDDVPYSEYQNGKWAGYFAHVCGGLDEAKKFIEAKY
jgi:hypothetical protein